MAEALLRHHAAESGIDDLFIDSAGTGAWHAGESPDHRMRQVGKRNGVVVEGAARQVRKDDLVDFDLILCSDSDILEQMLDMGADRKCTMLMLDFHPKRKGQDVPDPYYGGASGFDDVFTMLQETCQSIVKSIMATGR